MTPEAVMQQVQEEFPKITQLQVERITGLAKRDEGWVVTLESLERRAVPETMDILGLYELQLDEAGNFLGYERKRLRKRGDVDAI